MPINIDVTAIIPPAKFVNNAKVTDLDPLAKATLPREIEVQLPDGDGSKVPAMWHGNPSLAVNDYVRLRLDSTDAIPVVIGAGGSTADDADGYLLLAGKSGGQSANGGTGSGDDLTFDSTSNATKGDIILQPSGGDVGIGTSTPGNWLDVTQGDTGVKGLDLSNTNTGTGDYTAIRLGEDVGGAYWGGFFMPSSTNTNYAGAASLNLINIKNYPVGIGTNNLIRIFVQNDGDVGIGTLTPTATLDVDGGVAYNVVSKTGAYTATNADHVILCDATSAAFTINLPAASGVTGIVYHVKKTDSSANAITVDGNASETIDGATTQALSTQYDSIMIVCDGTSWHII